MSDLVVLRPGGCSDDVIVWPSGSLDEVPMSHQFLLTREVLHAFGNREEYFEELAGRCTYPYLREFCLQLSRSEEWALELCKSNSVDYFGPGRAVFRFPFGSSGRFSTAERQQLNRIPTIELLSEEERLNPVRITLPSCFSEFYSIFGRLIFDEFGGSIYWHRPKPAADLFSDHKMPCAAIWSDRHVFHCNGSDMFAIDVADASVYRFNQYEIDKGCSAGEPAEDWMRMYFEAIIQGEPPLFGI